MQSLFYKKRKVVGGHANAAPCDWMGPCAGPWTQAMRSVHRTTVHRMTQKWHLLISAIRSRMDGGCDTKERRVARVGVTHGGTMARPPGTPPGPSSRCPTSTRAIPMRSACRCERGGGVGTTGVTVVTRQRWQRHSGVEGGGGARQTRKGVERKGNSSHYRFRGERKQRGSGHRGRE